MLVASRVAVVGDIHAQDQQLATALRSISRLSVDAILCTGDVVDGHGSVERCCALLRDHDVITVRGNHDRWLFTGMLRDRPTSTQLESLPDRDREFLRTLPPTRTIRTVLGSLLLCHGIGTFDLETVTAYHTEYSLANNRLFREVVEAGHAVMVAGHSHERLVVRTQGLLIINAGAVAHPADAGFVMADLAAKSIQWHQIRHQETTVTEERFFDHLSLLLRDDRSST